MFATCRYRDQKSSDEEGVYGEGSNKEKMSEASSDKITASGATSACAASTTAGPSTTKSQVIANTVKHVGEKPQVTFILLIVSNYALTFLHSLTFSHPE